MNGGKWKVGKKEFRTLNEARWYRKQALAGLPESVDVPIERQVSGIPSGVDETWHWEIYE